MISSGRDTTQCYSGYPYLKAELDGLVRAGCAKRCTWAKTRCNYSDLVGQIPVRSDASIRCVRAR